MKKIITITSHRPLFAKYTCQTHFLLQPGSNVMMWNADLSLTSRNTLRDPHSQKDEEDNVHLLSNGLIRHKLEMLRHISTDSLVIHSIAYRFQTQWKLNQSEIPTCTVVYLSAKYVIPWLASSCSFIVECNMTWQRWTMNHC